MKSLPAVVENAVNPKPTKTEIIEAMALRYIEQQEKLLKDNQEKLKRITPALHKKLIYIAKRSKVNPSVNEGYWNGGSLYGVSVTISIEKGELPDDALNLLREYHEADAHVSIPILAYAKSMAKKALSEQAADKQERVSKLLQDKESSAALDSMLDALNL